MAKKTNIRPLVSVREAVDSFNRLSGKEKLNIARSAGVKLVPLKGKRDAKVGTRRRRSSAA